MNIVQVKSLWEDLREKQTDRRTDGRLKTICLDHLIKEHKNRACSCTGPLIKHQNKSTVYEYDDFFIVEYIHCQQKHNDNVYPHIFTLKSAALKHSSNLRVTITLHLLVVINFVQKKDQIQNV